MIIFLQLCIKCCVMIDAMKKNALGVGVKFKFKVYNF